MIYSLPICSCSPDDVQAMWRGGQEEGPEDHHGARSEGHGPAVYAGEGRRPGILRHKQAAGYTHADVPAGLYCEAFQAWHAHLMVAVL